MALVQTQPGSTVAMSATDWARLVAHGPTDVHSAPGSRLLVYPDAWTAAEVTAALRALGSSGGPSVPPGVPPS